MVILRILDDSGDGVIDALTCLEFCIKEKKTGCTVSGSVRDVKE